MMQHSDRMANWHKSTRSKETDCVEIGGAPGVAGVRDTKDRDGGTLVFSRTAWTQFLIDIRAQRFDTPR